MDTLPDVAGIGRLIAWMKADADATRAQAEEAVQEGERLQAESRRLAQEFWEIRVRRHLRLP
jgi:hypothetical protein